MGAADALDAYCETFEVDDESAAVRETKIVGYDGLPGAIDRIRKERNRFVATLAASPRKIVDKAFEVLCTEQELPFEVDIDIEDKDLITKESLDKRVAALP
jgi:hypothetical protein